VPSPTSRNQPARAALAALALVATCALSACGVGFDAQTNKIYTAPEGTDVRGGDVEGLNMLLVDNGDGSGTLVAALVNHGDEVDSLQTIVATDTDADGADEGGDFEVSGFDEPIELPAGKLVQLANGDPVVAFTSDTIAAGGFVQVTMTFTRAGSVTADIPVVDRAEPYADVPTPEPEPTPETTAPEG